MLLLIFTAIGSVLALLFISKRISLLEIYTTSFFATFLAALSDMYLDVKLDYYGFFNKGLDWEYIVIFIFIYPAANFIVLNFYPYKKTFFKKAIYILFCSIVTIIFEYISLKTEVFYYKEWKIWYSAICYPFIYTILILNLKFIRFLNKFNKIT